MKSRNLRGSVPVSPRIPALYARKIHRNDESSACAYSVWGFEGTRGLSCAQELRRGPQGE